ncbi:MAG: hypothetical protein E4H07_05010 [Nitrosomonadales bacterium]|nr:MAG: hypothetical protein E4H07_05010 [Nitrosomonadales bacterium]
MYENLVIKKFIPKEAEVLGCTIDGKNGTWKQHYRMTKDSKTETIYLRKIDALWTFQSDSRVA